jgi:hypothetical protein
VRATLCSIFKRALSTCVRLSPPQPVSWRSRATRAVADTGLLATFDAAKASDPTLNPGRGPYFVPISVWWQVRGVGDTHSTLGGRTRAHRKAA